MTRIFHWFLCERWIPWQAVTFILCLRYRPETVHCSTKDANISEITLLALHPCSYLSFYLLTYLPPTYLTCLFYLSSYLPSTYTPKHIKYILHMYLSTFLPPSFLPLYSHTEVVIFFINILDCEELRYFRSTFFSLIQIHNE